MFIQLAKCCGSIVVKNQTVIYFISQKISLFVIKPKYLISLGCREIVMKRVLASLTVLGVLMLSCSEPSSTDHHNNGQDVSVDTGFIDLDTSDMQQLSLQDYDLNLKLKVPIVSTATGQEISPVIEHIDGDYLWYISIGKYFNLVIEDYAKEFDKVKTQKQNLEEQKNVFITTYLEETTHLIFYKRELINDSGGKASYHCFGEIKIDGYNYVLRSEKIGGYEQVIRDMVASIKTAEPIIQSKNK